MYGTHHNAILAFFGEFVSSFGRALDVLQSLHLLLCLFEIGHFIDELKFRFLRQNHIYMNRKFMLTTNEIIRNYTLQMRHVHYIKRR